MLLSLSSSSTCTWKVFPTPRDYFLIICHIIYNLGVEIWEEKLAQKILYYANWFCIKILNFIDWTLSSFLKNYLKKSNCFEISTPWILSRCVTFHIFRNKTINSTCDVHSQSKMRQKSISREKNAHWNTMNIIKLCGYIKLCHVVVDDDADRWYEIKKLWETFRFARKIDIVISNFI